jgi:hypothetical protein
MNYRDEDPWAETEALEAEQFDADLLQSEMDAQGDAIARAWKAGRCTHGSATGYMRPPVSAAQEGLKRGQLRCTAGCKAVFGSDQDWYDAMDAALEGV